MSIAFTTEPSHSPLAEARPVWALGAGVGLVTTLLADRFDRRFLPWTALLMLAGVVSSSIVATASSGGPLALAVGLLLSLSIVVQARSAAGATGGAVTAPESQWLAGLVVTAGVLTIVGVAAGYMVVGSQPSPAYVAMRGDPMAAEWLPGMRLEYDDSRDESTPLGITYRPTIRRSWTVTDGSSVGHKVDDLCNLATASGWTPDRTDGACTLERTVDEHALVLTVRPVQQVDEVRLEMTDGLLDGTGDTSRVAKFADREDLDTKSEALRSLYEPGSRRVPDRPVRGRRVPFRVQT